MVFAVVADSYKSYQSLGHAIDHWVRVSALTPTAHEVSVHPAACWFANQEMWGNLRDVFYPYR